MSVSPDPGRPQSGNHDNGFGVKVRVQGIKGHSFVVMNNGGQQEHRDWPVARAAGGPAGPVARAAGGPAGPVARAAPDPSGPVGRPADGTLCGPCDDAAEYPCQFHFQKHPEILRAYDPQDNHLSVLVATPTASVSDSSSDTDRSDRTSRTSGTSRPSGTRAPPPTQGGGVESETQNGAASGEDSSGGATPARSPNSVDTDSIPSVGRLIDRFSRGTRDRVDVEERRRRSRSVEGGACPPGQARTPRMARVRFSMMGESSSSRGEGEESSRGNGEESFGGNGSEEKKPVANGIAVNGLSTNHSPEDAGRRNTLSTNHSPEDAGRRNTLQVTPDLLKGQKEMSEEPAGGTVGQNHLLLPQEGTEDNGGTTQMTEHSISKDYSSVVKALQQKISALEKQVSDLKNKLQTEAKNQRLLARACEKARTQRNSLQEDLDKHQEEISKLRTGLSGAEAELQSTKDKLGQVTADRDRSRMEMKDLQQQLSDMHDELDSTKVTAVEREDLLKEVQALLSVQEEQQEVLRWRERELTALQGALQEEVEHHQKDMDLLREDFLQKTQTLQRDLSVAQESVAALSQQKAQMAQQKVLSDSQVELINEDREKLRRQAAGLEERLEELNLCIHKSRALEKHLELRASQLEVEKQQGEESLVEARRREDDVCLSNQTLTVHLENIQGQLTKLKAEHGDLKVKLKDQKNQSEDLWKTRSDLEEEKKNLDRTVDALQRKMTSVLQQCSTDTDKLQRQIEESRDVHQRALSDLTAQLQEKEAELERVRQTAKTLHEELFPVEQDLQRCRRESQEARLRSRQLEERLQETLDRNSSQLDERERKVKLLEGRIVQLEGDLREERSSADRLMERVDKTKEQMDQMRVELLQERAVRQDLECDKSTLERQNKDLKSRLGHVEGSQKTSQDSVISKLNTRIQELEDRLQGEERDNINLQQTNRKLERKVKEMKIHVDEEHLSLQSQRDQLTQRLKTAKRQIDEVEAEMERLEHDKKRLMRELDEQLEMNQSLQDQMNALRSTMRVQKKSRCVVRDEDDDANDEDGLGSD